MRKSNTFKMLSMLIAIALMVSMLAACGKTPAQPATDETTISESEITKTSIEDNAKDDIKNQANKIPDAIGKQNEDENVETPYDDTKYTYDGESDTIVTADLPYGYLLRPYGQFKQAFADIVNGRINSASTYENVAAAFGGEGIFMTNMETEDTAYYAWYADEDYLLDTKVNILISFTKGDTGLLYNDYTVEGLSSGDFTE